MSIKRMFPLLVAMLLCLMPVMAQRPKVGLVLGGGGAKGAAEVGVLKEIERQGIPIDYIAGTSIGAIVGGLYAVGYRAEFLDSMFRSQEWLSLFTDRSEQLGNDPYRVKDGVTYIFGVPVWRDKGKSRKNIDFGNLGVMKGDSITSLLQRMTAMSDSVDFNELPIPFRCVAFDLNTDSEQVLSSGSLALAMRSSMAIPGLFKPVNIDGMRLVDGGMANNLPVDVVRKMGADIVIAIDLTQDKERYPSRFQLKEWTGIGGVLNYLVSRPDLKKYHENLKSVDLYINPDITDAEATSFSKAAIVSMLKAGEREGKRQSKALAALKARIMAKASPDDVPEL